MQYDPDNPLFTRQRLNRINSGNSLVQLFQLYPVAVFITGFVGKEPADLRALDFSTRHLRGVSVYLISSLLKPTSTDTN